MVQPPSRFATLWRFDEVISSAALVLMTLIPLVEILSRPSMGKGIENSAVLTQHLGLMLAMFGAVAAERYGHLTTLGSGVGALGGERFQKAMQAFPTQPPLGHNKSFPISLYSCWFCACFCC